MQIDEKNRSIYILGAVFGIAILYQVFTNYIPSIIESTKPPEEIELSETIQERIKDRLQKGLEVYKENSVKKASEDKDKKETSKHLPPKTFSQFVSYKDNKPEGSTVNLEEFSEYFVGEDAVDGLDSKKLVIQLLPIKKKEKVTAVYLLNSSYIGMTEF